MGFDTPKSRFLNLRRWIDEKGIKYYKKNFPEDYKKVRHLKVFKDYINESPSKPM